FPKLIGGVSVRFIIRANPIDLSTGQREEKIDLLTELLNRIFLIGFKLGVCSEYLFEVRQNDKSWFLLENPIIFSQLINALHEFIWHTNLKENLTLVEQFAHYV